MMRKIPWLLAAPFLFLAHAAFALTCPPLPYSFTNGTVAQAPQVNANFSTIWNCFYAAAQSYSGAVSTGTPNAQALTYSNGPSPLVTGTLFFFQVGAGLTNTGPTTMNIDSTGALNVHINGSALKGGEFVAGAAVPIYYDGTSLDIISSPFTNPLAGTPTITSCTGTGGWTGTCTFAANSTGDAGEIILTNGSSTYAGTVTVGLQMPSTAPDGIACSFQMAQGTQTGTVGGNPLAIPVDVSHIEVQVPISTALTSGKTALILTQCGQY